MADTDDEKVARRGGGGLLGSLSEVDDDDDDAMTGDGSGPVPAGAPAGEDALMSEVPDSDEEPSRLTAKQKGKKAEDAMEVDEVAAAAEDEDEGEDEVEGEEEDPELAEAVRLSLANVR